MEYAKSVAYSRKYLTAREEIFTQNYQLSVTRHASPAILLPRVYLGISKDILCQLTDYTCPVFIGDRFTDRSQST
jgi:hypothetical protein